MAMSTSCVCVTGHDIYLETNAHNIVDVYDSPQLRGGWGTREMSRGVNNAVSSTLISTNYFRKAYLYANSRLPSHLPPLKL